MLKILLVMLVLLGCSTIKDSLPELPHVKIVKHTGPKIVLIKEPVVGNIGVTGGTRYVQLLYYAKSEHLESIETGHKVREIKKVDLMISSNYIREGNLKKITAIFGPMSYAAQYKIEIRAGNSKGLGEPNFKDRKYVYVTVDRGTRHGRMRF